MTAIVKHRVKKLSSAVENFNSILGKNMAKTKILLDKAGIQINCFGTIPVSLTVFFFRKEQQNNIKNEIYSKVDSSVISTLTIGA